MSAVQQTNQRSRPQTSIFGVRLGVDPKILK